MFTLILLLPETNRQNPWLTDSPEGNYHFFIISSHQPLTRNYARFVPPNIEEVSNKLAFYQQLRFPSAEPVFVVFAHQYEILAVQLKCGADAKNHILRTISTLLTHNGFYAFYHGTSQSIPAFRQLFYEYLPLLDFYSHFPKTARPDLREWKREEVIPSSYTISYPPLDEGEEAAQKLEPYLNHLFANHNLGSIDSFFKGFCYHYETALNHPRLFENEVFLTDLPDLRGWFHPGWRRCADLWKNKHAAAYSPIITRAVDLLKTNYGNADLNIAELSHSVGMSPGRLGQLFKQETNQTINDYLTDIRMNAAVFLLKNTNEKVYAIAEKVGYRSVQYFSQIFYKKTGQKPLELRKMEVQNDE